MVVVSCVLKRAMCVCVCACGRVGMSYIALCGGADVKYICVLNLH